MSCCARWRRGCSRGSGRSARPSPLKAEVGESVRGVRVVGTMDALDKALADLTAKGLTVTRILAAGDVLSPGDDTCPPLRLT